MRTAIRLLSASTVAIALAGSAVLADRVTLSAGPTVEITFSAAARKDAVTGRVYVAFSRTAPNGRQTPIGQTDPTGVPLFSALVTDLAPGVIVRPRIEFMKVQRELREMRNRKT